MEKVKLKLVGLDGNPFNLLFKFILAAQEQGWESDEIDEVLKLAQSKDYNFLLYTLMGRCVEPKEVA